MLRLSITYSIFTLINVINAKVLSGIFTRFVSLTQSSYNSYSFDGPMLTTWIAALGWEINGTKAKPGDTFTLEMPCVYKIFINEESIDLIGNDISLATCEVHSGEHISTNSYLNCVMNDSLDERTNIDGILRLPIMFNVGGSGQDTDLDAASSCFNTDSNIIAFNNGDTSISIQRSFSVRAIFDTVPINFVRVGKTISELEVLIVAPNCPQGYTNGRLAIAASDRDVIIKCSTITSGFASKLNKWNLPENLVQLYHGSLCTSRQFSISYTNIPEGYRPFLLVTLSNAVSSSFNLRYTIQNTCEKDTFNDQSRSVSWRKLNYGSLDSYGGIMIPVTRTRTGTASTRLVTTRPFDPSTHRTKTIEIIVPIPTRTRTSSYLGITTSISTINAYIGATATVIVNNPYHVTTTLTTYWTGSTTSTTTSIAQTDSIDEVYVLVPVPNPTITRTEFWTGSYFRTTTVTNRPRQTDIVQVEVPQNPTTTITTLGNVQSRLTSIQTNGPLNTDTVVVIVPPNPTVTTSSFWSEDYASVVTYTNDVLGTDFVVAYFPVNPTSLLNQFWTEDYISTETQTNDPEGTDYLVVYYPPNPTTTTSEFWTGDYVNTVTLQNEPQETDTVIVQYPANPTETTTEFWSEDYRTTLTQMNDPSGTDNVIVYAPANPAVTTAEFWPNSVTSSVTETNGPDNTDTIVVYVPHNPTTTRTEFWTGDYATRVTHTYGPDTTDEVVAYYPFNQVITRTEFWTEDFTSTITDDNGAEETDNVDIYVPPDPTSISSTIWLVSDTIISIETDDSDNSSMVSIESSTEVQSITEVLHIIEFGNVNYNAIPGQNNFSTTYFETWSKSTDFPSSTTRTTMHSGHVTTSQQSDFGNSKAIYSSSDQHPFSSNEMSVSTSSVEDVLFSDVFNASVTSETHIVQTSELPLMDIGSSTSIKYFYSMYSVENSHPQSHLEESLLPYESISDQRWTRMPTPSTLELHPQVSSTELPSQLILDISYVSYNLQNFVGSNILLSSADNYFLVSLPTTHTKGSSSSYFTEAETFIAMQMSSLIAEPSLLSVLDSGISSTNPVSASIALFETSSSVVPLILLSSISDYSYESLSTSTNEFIILEGNFLFMEYLNSWKVTKESTVENLGTIPVRSGSESISSSILYQNVLFVTDRPHIGTSFGYETNVRESSSLYVPTIVESDSFDMKPTLLMTVSENVAIHQVGLFVDCPSSLDEINTNSVCTHDFPSSILESMDSNNIKYTSVNGELMTSTIFATSSLLGQSTTVHELVVTSLEPVPTFMIEHYLTSLDAEFVSLSSETNHFENNLEEFLTSSESMLSSFDVSDGFTFLETSLERQLTYSHKDIQIPGAGVSSIDEEFSYSESFPISYNYHLTLNSNSVSALNIFSEVVESVTSLDSDEEIIPGFTSVITSSSKDDPTTNIPAISLIDTNDMNVNSNLFYHHSSMAITEEFESTSLQSSATDLLVDTIEVVNSNSNIYHPVYSLAVNVRPVYWNESTTILKSIISTTQFEKAVSSQSPEFSISPLMESLSIDNSPNQVSISTLLSSYSVFSTVVHFTDDIDSLLSTGTNEIIDVGDYDGKTSSSINSKVTIGSFASDALLSSIVVENGYTQGASSSLNDISIADLQSIEKETATIQDRLYSVTMIESVDISTKSVDRKSEISKNEASHELWDLLSEDNDGTKIENYPSDDKNLITLSESLISSGDISSILSTIMSDKNNLAMVTSIVLDIPGIIDFSKDDHKNITKSILSLDSIFQYTTLTQQFVSAFTPNISFIAKGGSSTLFYLPNWLFINLFLLVILL